MPEDVATQSVETEISPQEQLGEPNPIKRLGCGLLLVIWFMLLLTPCTLFYLATNGEIRVWHSDIPEPHSHPRLLVELVSEIDYRGLRLERSSSVDNDLSDNATCVQTSVSYLLWESIEDDLDTTYCDCYVREDDVSEWVLTSTVLNMCTTTP